MGAGEAQREGAGAAEQVRDLFCVHKRLAGELGQPLFSRFGRLQEAAGRQRNKRLAERDARRPSLDHGLAVIGDAREIEPVRRARELLRLGARERPRAAKVDVEPGERCGDADVERFHHSPQIAAQRSRSRNRAGHAGAEQRAGVDCDDVVRARAHEADLVRLAMRKAGVEGCAAPAAPMRIDQLANLRRHALALERLDDEAALPCAIERSRHVLRGAAAAGAEPAADRLRAPGRRVQPLDELRAPALALDERALAGQGQGNDRSVGGDAVSMRVERDDQNLFERLRHGARR